MLLSSIGPAPPSRDRRGPSSAARSMTDRRLRRARRRPARGRRVAAGGARARRPAAVPVPARDGPAVPAVRCHAGVRARRARRRRWLDYGAVWVVAAAGASVVIGRARRRAAGCAALAAAGGRAAPGRGPWRHAGRPSPVSRRRTMVGVSRSPRSRSPIRAERAAPALGQRRVLVPVLPGHSAVAAGERDARRRTRAGAGRRRGRSTPSTIPASREAARRRIGAVGAGRSRCAPGSSNTARATDMQQRHCRTPQMPQHERCRRLAVGRAGPEPRDGSV